MSRRSLLRSTPVAAALGVALLLGACTPSADSVERSTFRPAIVAAGGALQRYGTSTGSTVESSSCADATERVLSGYRLSCSVKARVTTKDGVTHHYTTQGCVYSVYDGNTARSGTRGYYAYLPNYTFKKSGNKWVKTGEYNSPATLPGEGPGLNPCEAPAK